LEIQYRWADDHLIDFHFPDCWPILRQYLGAVRPAATMISAGLSDPRMQIEFQVTARKRIP